ncbi:unnamed protein product [Paramecium sonneborni]|uniref:HTH psq-type domain-containing protein n=1 Tax=Paramecium sonneborni TaxID=65129 RepID=A0A8S1KS83_9CILI|nr:unnamed protein product [Paramecium sonneborni]CAD8057767.1 unnamed protein product [Paramecium sonneborni]CAD8057769.1 unnamed protein product [Paramecium sonneborni]CAD8057785.1 unnamed protein product [Paramecium sonneborni]CAD8057787.1 unnamed protein product [Paramecium sonneborni]
MSISNKSIQKKSIRGSYNKISQELKAQILMELDLYNNINELSKKYGIARQTITSFKKAKEHIYDQFKNAITHLIHELINIRFHSYENLSKQAVLKDIKFFIKNQQYFEFSEKNPLKKLIPETKIFSQKKRIIQFVLDDAFSYYDKKMYQKSAGIVELEITQEASEQSSTIDQPKIQEDIYIDEQSSKLENLLPTWLLNYDDDSFIFQRNDTFLDSNFVLM